MPKKKLIKELKEKLLSKNFLIITSVVAVILVVIVFFLIEKEYTHRLTQSDVLASKPIIVINGNNVHVIWYNSTGWGSGTVYYKRSIDGGATWGNTANLTTGVWASVSPDIAVAGDNVYVVWLRNHDDINWSIDYKYSANNGLDWSDEIRLTYARLFGSPPGPPSITASESTVHIAWINYSDRSVEVLYQKSFDNGTTWSNPVILSIDDNISSINPDIISDEDNVYLVWADGAVFNYETYFRRSNDNGVNWTEPIRVSDHIRLAARTRPDIAIENKNIHVVWHNQKDLNIYYKHSLDEGETWGDEIKISDVKGTREHEPKKAGIAVINNTVHVVWADPTSGNYEVYYRYSNDSGFSWSNITSLSFNLSEANLSINGTTSSYPDIVVNDYDIHLVWEDDLNGHHIFYTKLINEYLMNQEQERISIVYQKLINVIWNYSLNILILVITILLVFFAYKYIKEKTSLTKKIFLFGILVGLIVGVFLTLIGFQLKNISSIFEGEAPFVLKGKAEIIESRTPCTSMNYGYSNAIFNGSHIEVFSVIPWGSPCTGLKDIDYQINGSEIYIKMNVNPSSGEGGCILCEAELAVRYRIPIKNITQDMHVIVQDGGDDWIYLNKICVSDDDCVTGGCCSSPRSDCINKNYIPDCTNTTCIAVIYQTCEYGACNCIEGECQRLPPEGCN